MSTTRRAPAPPPPPDAQHDEPLIMNLEPDQFVAETSRPVARIALRPRARAGLWALRIFAVTVSAMVIYTFVAQLR